MKRQIFPTTSKYRRRTRREFGGETVEYIIVILAVVVIGGGLMGFGNQVSGQVTKTGNSISSWFGKANDAGDNASGGNGAGGGNNASGGNKGDENSGSQLQAPTVSITGMDVVGERVTAKAPICQMVLPELATNGSTHRRKPELSVISNTVETRILTKSRKKTRTITFAAR